MNIERYILKNAAGERIASLATTRSETLLDCLLRNDRPIKTTCYGSLICGGCRVVVEEGGEELAPPTRFELEILARVARDEPRTRLACQVVLPEGVSEITVSTSYW
ncbi:MAG: (2Fe-2S)-binding protein [Alphaproteobacteria bacterium]|nr:(2Fe-2S)-binding protein [Alphaproteobacteria bacterium]MCB9698044.1 (2Fe-2S)-binding protein [Alphaproteobacteria bacterium]